MSKDGYTVILEGRAQTVNYVDTKYRFELTMSDPSLIGKRRAAQRIAASAMEDCAASADDAAVTASVKSALSKLMPAYDVLSKQDSVTSNWIINSLANDPVFAQFGDSETKSILARDAEDDEKLAAGIKIAVDKGVLKAISPPPQGHDTLVLLVLWQRCEIHINVWKNFKIFIVYFGCFRLVVRVDNHPFF